MQSIVTKINNEGNISDSRLNTCEIDEIRMLKQCADTNASRWHRSSALATEVLSEELRRIETGTKEGIELENRSQYLNDELNLMWSKNSILQSKIEQLEKLIERERYFKLHSNK